MKEPDTYLGAQVSKFYIDDATDGPCHLRSTLSRL
jgi:hypothetical protein